MKDRSVLACFKSEVAANKGLIVWRTSQPQLWPRVSRSVLVIMMWEMARVRPGQARPSSGRHCCPSPPAAAPQWARCAVRGPALAAAPHNTRAGPGWAEPGWARLSKHPLSYSTISGQISYSQWAEHDSRNCQYFHCNSAKKERFLRVPRQPCQLQPQHVRGGSDPPSHTEDSFTLTKSSPPDQHSLPSWTPRHGQQDRTSPLLRLHDNRHPLRSRSRPLPPLSAAPGLAPVPVPEDPLAARLRQLRRWQQQGPRHIRWWRWW